MTKNQKDLISEVATLRKDTREAIREIEDRAVTVTTLKGMRIIQQLLEHRMILEQCQDMSDYGGGNVSCEWKDASLLRFSLLSEKGIHTVEAFKMQHSERLQGLPMSEWIPEDRKLPRKTEKEDGIQEKGFFVAKYKKQSYFTNGHGLFRGDPPANAYRLKRDVDLAPTLDLLTLDSVAIGRVLGFSFLEGLRENDTVVWIVGHDIVCAIDTIYYDYVMKHFPKAIFGLTLRLGIIGVYVGDEIVGAIMPVRYGTIPENIEKMRN